MTVIALVGLPNVGKSTIFNKLVGRSKAIVDNIPGITRDRNESQGRLSDLEFKIIDTGGIDKKSDFASSIFEQVEMAIYNSDIILFVVDAKLILDEQAFSFGKWLRKITSKPIIIVANKCESYKTCHDINGFQHMNFIGPVYISAEHNLGFIDLYESLTLAMSMIGNNTGCNTIVNTDKTKISIIGQPNVGKSTFINHLLGENRVITNSKQGTTRDSIDIIYWHNNNQTVLIDTAGMRKKKYIVDNVETLSVKNAISSIRSSNIVILMIDATEEIQKQDLNIAEIIIKEGKGLIIALNKWDLILRSKQKDLLFNLRKYNKLDFEVPIVEISAINGLNCKKIIDIAVDLFNLLKTRINTSSINRWLLSAIENHSPPLSSNGRKIRLKYMTQIGIVPPTFVIMSNNIKDLNDTYKKYLVNDFRKNFNFIGVPIIMSFKKSKNPYLVKSYRK